MNSNFHIKDLVEYLDFVSEVSPRTNVLELLFHINSKDQKIIDRIRHYYPLENEDSFLIFKGYDGGAIINFFKVYENQIVLQVQKDSDEYLSLICPVGKWFLIDVNYNMTIDKAFNLVITEYNKYSNNFLATDEYTGMMSHLKNYIIRILKIYTRYIKTGKIKLFQMR